MWQAGTHYARRPQNHVLCSLFGACQSRPCFDLPTLRHAVLQRGGRPTKYCSRACRYRAARTSDGEDRRSWVYRRWRHAVHARDGYACVRCGSRHHLHAHHIVPWTEHPEARFEIANGVTLCADCHETEHGRRMPRTARSYLCRDCGAPTKARARSRLCRSCAGKRGHFSSLVTRAGERPQPTILSNITAT